MNIGDSDKSRVAVPLPFIIGFGLFVIVGGYLAGVVLTPSLFPPQASAEARQVDELFRILLIIGGAVFLLVQGLLVYSVLRFRVPMDDTADGPSIHGNATLELVWTAIPSVIVFVLAILSYQVWVDIRSEKPNENIYNGAATPIHVTGQRFAWSFAYLREEVDREGNSVIVPSSILYTYAGQNVHLQMDAEDVIHSFWVPAMRVKQDVMPGRTTDIRFTVQPPDGTVFPERGFIDYPIVCAELCGSGHGDMRAILRVYESDQRLWEDYMQEAIDVVVNPPADPVLRGQSILLSGAYPCHTCHTLNPLSWTGNQGPSLDGIGDRASERVGGMTAEEYLKDSLYNPHDFVVAGYTPIMPDFQGDDPTAPFYMSEFDRAAIVAYLCAEVSSGEPACIIDPSEIGADAEATAEPGLEATAILAPQDSDLTQEPEEVTPEVPLTGN